MWEYGTECIKCNSRNLNTCLIHTATALVLLFLNYCLSVPLITAKQMYFTHTYNIHLSYFSHMNTQQDKGKKECFSP
jgi:hypothetical protein